ncbi:MAG: energy transducer TonB [bacterium]
MLFSNQGRFNPFGIEPGKLTESEEGKALRRSIDTSKLPKKKHPGFDLKGKYTKTLEISFSLALAIVIVFFQFLRHTGAETLQLEQLVQQIEVEEIPITEQIRRPPPPARPQIPLPTDNEEIPEEETIAFSEIDFAKIPEPPPPPEITEESSNIFVAYDVPPEPIDGWSSLHKYLVYPELAIKANMEAKVFIKALVNTEGIVEDARVLKSSGSNAGFDEAALKAAFKIKWRPALQRDVPVKVWIAFPVSFELASDT